MVKRLWMDLYRNTMINTGIPIPGSSHGIPIQWVTCRSSYSVVYVCMVFECHSQRFSVASSSASWLSAVPSALLLSAVRSS